MPLARKQKGSPEITFGPVQLKGRAVPWLTLTLVVTALKEIWKASRNQRLPSPAPRKDQPWVNLSWQLGKPRSRSLPSSPFPAGCRVRPGRPGTLRTCAWGWQRWSCAVRASRLASGSARAHVALPCLAEPGEREVVRCPHIRHRLPKVLR